MNLGQLADALALPVHGDKAFEVAALASLSTAGPQDISFVANARYATAMNGSKAGALIIPPSLSNDHLPTGNYLISENAYASYAQASWLLNPPPEIRPGVHPTAVVHDQAQVSDTASIGPQVVIGAHSLIDAHVRIDAHCVVGQRVNIGERSRLFPRVSLYDHVTIGTDCRIQSGAVLGAEGFGYAWSGSGWLQIQQIGGVRLGNEVHIGANTTIDCGAMDPTVIADGVIIDNQVQIAHNVHIGEKTAIAGCAGIAGSTRIGSHCQIGGACNIVGHLTIADGVVLNAASLVTQSINKKGRYGSGTPLLSEHAWRRSFVNLGKLDALVKRVKRLERWSASSKS